MSVKKHKKQAPKGVSIGIITVSTTRTAENDKSGLWMKKRAKKEGHRVVYHQRIPDNAVAIKQTLISMIHVHSPDALIVTGGTGISPQDVTVETIRPMFKKEMTAFGFLFTQLSYEKVDSAAILSRTTAGIIGHTVVFCIPGSIKACKVACKNLIFPELCHIVMHLEEDILLDDGTLSDNDRPEQSLPGHNLPGHDLRVS